MRIDTAISPETEAIIARLMLVPIGEQISYAALSEAIGRNVQGQALATLTSARRIIMREHGVAFQVIRKSGLRRLNPNDAADIGHGARGKIRRLSTRAATNMRRVAAASNGLSPDAARRLSSELAVMGVLSQITTDKAAVALATDNEPMPVAIASRAFLDFIGATK